MPYFNILSVKWLTILILTKLCGSVAGGAFVDPNVVNVKEWEGWGTTLAWWTELIGDLDDSVVDPIIAALFHKDQLNFNIVRFVIGGTTPMTRYHSNVENTDLEQQAPVTRMVSINPITFLRFKFFKGTRDAKQRKILSKSINAGATTIEAISNSPPEWMTVSGCSKGNPNDAPTHNNLALDMVDSFVEYAADVIDYYHRELGITFTSYAPFNEPSGLYGIGGWIGNPSTVQEGCNMNKSVMIEVVKRLSEKLEASGMNYVGISAPDETQVNTALGTLNHFKEQNVISLISKINVHGYWNVPGTRRDLLSTFSARENKTLWMDELSGPGFHFSPADDMISQGINVGIRLVKDLRQMQPSAWLWWQAVQGLILIPLEKPEVSAEDIQYGSGFYALMQFSKYILPGYSLIFVSDENSVAAVDPSRNELVIVTVNYLETEAPKDFNILLALKQSTSEVVRNIVNISLTQTSASAQNAPITTGWEYVDSKYALQFTAQPLSITTAVIQLEPLNSPEIPIAPPNLIKNGGFENGLEYWELRYGAENDTGLSESAWRGNSSGFFSLWPSNYRKQLVHTFVLVNDEPEVTHFDAFLSAWCSSNGFGVELILSIDDDSFPVVPVAPYVGYKQYGVTGRFEAKKSHTIKFTFMSNLGPAHIDDVVLHISGVKMAANNVGLLTLNNYAVIICLLVYLIIC